MEIATDIVSETVLCSKCELNPRADPDGTNPWCNPCKTKYMKEWTEMRLKRTGDQAFVRGAEAMRRMLVSEFERLGIGQFTGYDVGRLIRGAVAPKQEPVMER